MKVAATLILLLCTSGTLSAQSRDDTWSSRNDRACAVFTTAPAKSDKLDGTENNVQTARELAERPNNNASTKAPDAVLLRDCLTRIADSYTVAIANASREKNGPSLRLIEADSRIPLLPAGRVNSYLIAEHINLGEMKHWVDRLEGDSALTTMAVETKLAFERADHAVEALLEDRGLREVFTAFLVSGAVVGTGKSSDKDMSGNTSAKPIAHVVWTTEHFGSDTGRWDLSLGGKFGFISALGLTQDETTIISKESKVTGLGTDGKSATVTVPTSVTTTKADPEASYQSAFVWDAGSALNLQFKAHHSSELSFLFRAGQTVLNADPILVEDGGKSTLTLPIGGKSNAQWFAAAGFEYSLFRTTLDEVHAQGATSPALSVRYQLVRDNQFKNVNELEDAVEFIAPVWRQTFRLSLDAMKIFDKRELGEKSKPFTLGFVVEYNGALSWPFKVADGKVGAHIPPGTQFMFRGDLDLLKALKGG